MTCCADDRDWTHAPPEMRIRLSAKDYLSIDLPRREDAMENIARDMYLEAVAREPDAALAAEGFLVAMSDALEALRTARDDALCDVARLGRLLDDACDEVHARDLHIAELEGQLAELRSR